MAKIQILYIHGGMTFRSREEYIEYLRTRELSIDFNDKWSTTYLDENLPLCKVIRPRMPLSEYSNYEDWKIHFERYLELVDEEIILMGLSLGGMFLVKYLAENDISKKVLSLYVVGAPFDGSGRKYIAGGFDLPDDISYVEGQCENIRMLFSEDDPVVPIAHAERFQAELPDAKIYRYSDKKGHFKIKEFPEIVQMIKEDIRRISQ